MRARISPACRAFTASGLMIENVRSVNGLTSALLLERFRHRGPDVRRGLHHPDAGLFHRLHLLGRGALAAGDDGPRVAHAPAGGGGLAGDEAHHRLPHALLHEGGGLLLGVAPDLADHDDGGGPGVVVEQAQGIRVVAADDRIAADADAGGLADAEGRELGHRLVGEGPGPADHAHRPALARGDPAHHVRAVVPAADRVEGPVLPHPLDEEARVLADEDAHRAPPAAATTFFAASVIWSAVAKFRPEVRSISLPFSSLLPFLRTTTGTLTSSCFTAAITPSASTSQRRMPPKMLMSTAFTSRSPSRMRKAFRICSAFAPPPTSRKFAGLPPASLMMSMVAMARPAPFTMQPTLPASSLM